MLEGYYLDGILALLGAKALFLAILTFRALRAQVRSSTTWPTFGSRTGRDKLRAW